MYNYVFFLSEWHNMSLCSGACIETDISARTVKIFTREDEDSRRALIYKDSF